MSEFTCPELVACTSIKSRIAEREQTRKKSTALPVPISNEDARVNPDEEKHGSLLPNEFTVEWDGDEDPLCPRSMSYFRKWVIVSIVSMGSLLV